MNQRDLSNLDFLRSLSPEALLKWYEQASEDDIEYASELLAAWEQELTAAEFEVFDSDFTVVSTLVH